MLESLTSKQSTFLDDLFFVKKDYFFKIGNKLFIKKVEFNAQII
jgi:hypothetical protein